MDTWQPEPPIKIGDYDVEFLDSGDIKVGCTTVDSATFEKIVKKRETQKRINGLNMLKMNRELYSNLILLLKQEDIIIIGIASVPFQIGKLANNIAQ